MLVVLIVLGIVAYLFAVPSPEPPRTEGKPAVPPQVIVIHHRPVYVQAQVQLIQAKIEVAEKQMGPPPIRVPEAKLLTTSTAIERYRSNGRS